jgi:chromosome segregation ATPase
MESMNNILADAVMAIAEKLNTISGERDDHKFWRESAESEKNEAEARVENQRVEIKRLMERVAEGNKRIEYKDIEINEVTAKYEAELKKKTDAIAVFCQKVDNLQRALKEQNDIALKFKREQEEMKEDFKAHLATVIDERDQYHRALKRRGVKPRIRKS